MINYNGKQWIRLFFSVNGTVLPRVAFRLALIGGLTLALLLVNEYHPFHAQLPSVSPIGHTLIAVSLGLLIVFRSNTSYDRYWEGRRLWGGIINANRNLMRSASAFCPDTKELARLLSAYVLAVKQHLRDQPDLSELESFLTADRMNQVRTVPNPGVVLLAYASQWLVEQLRAGHIDTQQLWILEREVANLSDCQGGCERIVRTPIPFSSAVHIKQTLMVYLFTLPFVLMPAMGWYALPAVLAISFSLLGIDAAGVEIEDPFGDDPNDLPLEIFCATVARDAFTLGKSVDA